MRRQSNLFIILLWLAAAVSVRSQTTNRPVSLAEARRVALQRNWDLLAAHADVDAATAQRLISREFPNPTLSVTLSKVSADSAHGSSTPVGNGFFERSYDTVAAVSQLLEVGGKRRARQGSAKAGLEAARARLGDARRLLDLGVTRSYVAALTAEENARILGDSAASLRKEAELAATRLRAGDISRGDSEQIEIAASRLEVEARRAAADARNARVQLEVVLGERQPNGATTLADSLESLLAGMEPESTRGGGPIEPRPDVRAAEAEARRAAQDLWLQKAMRIPDPTVSLIYEHEPPDQPHTVGLGVSIPLPLWNRNRGSIAAAQAAREQAETLAAKAAAQAVAEVSIAQGDFEAARARHQDYLNSILPKSAAVRQTVTFAYQKGGATLLDLLSAQRNDNEVRLAAAEAAADMVAARAALAAARNERSNRLYE